MAVEPCEQFPELSVWHLGTECCRPLDCQGWKKLAQPNLVPFESVDALATAAAETFVARANEAIESRGRFTVALSGGSTPLRMYAKLLDAEMDWGKVDVFWSDERCVPPSHPESNQGAADRALLEHVLPAREFGMFSQGSPDVCAVEYERVLRSVVSDPPVLDLVLLGMGADGHVASLFPGIPELHEEKRSVVATQSPAGIAERVSFTFPMILAARSVLLLVAGADKAKAFDAGLQGTGLPVSRILHSSAQVYAAF